jgi:hypothetical protein
MIHPSCGTPLGTITWLTNVYFHTFFVIWYSKMTVLCECRLTYWPYVPVSDHIFIGWLIDVVVCLQDDIHHQSSPFLVVQVILGFKIKRFVVLACKSCRFIFFRDLLELFECLHMFSLICSSCIHH